MKNVFKTLGIIAIVAVIGFTISCGDEDNGGGGGSCTHTPGVTATCTTAQTCTQCGHVIQVSLGHDWDWETHTSGLRDCQRNSCTVTAGIGHIGPAGGIIFYVEPSGFDVEGYSGGVFATAHLNFTTYKAYYLEVAPADESDAAQWGALLATISGVTSFVGTVFPEASLIGNGRKDTYAIVTYLSIYTSETGRAAQLCASKSLNSNDWFLPSSGELNQLYINRVAVNNAGGNLGTIRIWSSSQSGTGAWYQTFNYGDRNNFFKSNTCRVRAIRAF